MLETAREKLAEEVRWTKLIDAIRYLIEVVYHDQPTARGYDDYLKMMDFLRIETLCMSNNFCLDEYFERDFNTAFGRVQAYCDSITKAVAMGVEDEKIELCLLHIQRIKEALTKKGYGKALTLCPFGVDEVPPGVPKSLDN